MNAIVVYATITGNNEAVADIIIDQLKSHDVMVTKSEISQTEVEDLQNQDIAVVVPYTYDNGSLPDEGLDFYDDLEFVDLSGTKYGVAGSGDLFYEDDYCVAVDKFDTALSNAKANKAAQNVKINLIPDKTDEEQLKKFVNDLLA